MVNNRRFLIRKAFNTIFQNYSWLTGVRNFLLISKATPSNKTKSRLPNSTSNPVSRFEECDCWSFDLVRYFDWWKDLSRKGLQNAMCNVSMASWLRFQGGVPLRVWDRLGVTAQEDTLLIRTPVCIGLNLNHA